MLPVNKSRNTFMAKSDKANEKTNVMRLPDQAGIAYTPRYYDASLASGTEAIDGTADGVVISKPAKVYNSLGVMS